MDNVSCENAVREFHVKYGHFISDKATVAIPEVVKARRLALILEEMKELREALLEENIIEIADGIGDLVYVLVGTAISYGIPFDRVFQEIHRSNMTKTDSKAPLGEKYGTKTPKGPDFIAPDLFSILHNPMGNTWLEILATKRKTVELLNNVLIPGLPEVS